MNPHDKDNTPPPDDEKIIALVDFLTDNYLGLGSAPTPDEITDHGDGLYSYGQHDFLVLNDVEAETELDEALDDYLYECLYPEMPEFGRRYFNEEAWKRDARMEGRGHTLATYDGEEHESGNFFIYRTN